MIQFKRLSPEAIIPRRGTSGAAGFDIYAAGNAKVQAGDYISIPTKIAVRVPDGYVGLIKPRSGLAVRHGIDTMAGVIDSDYTGEIKVILTKHSHGELRINEGDRIAQLVITKIETEWEEVDELEGTDRGEKGFGSTGV